MDQDLEKVADSIFPWMVILALISLPSTCSQMSKKAKNWDSQNQQSEPRQTVRKANVSNATINHAKLLVSDKDAEMSAKEADRKRLLEKLSQAERMLAEGLDKNDRSIGEQR